MQRMTVQQAEELVAAFEELSDSQVNSILCRANGDSMVDEYVTAKCILNFWWFLKFGVSYPMKHYYAPLHGYGPHPLTGRGLAKFLEDWTIEEHGATVPVQVQFVVMAREHCKTQEASIAYPLWELARDPNHRILLRSHVDRKAYEILGGIKDIIDNCESFGRRFPWVTPKMERRRRLQWANDRIIIERDDIGIRTSTIEAYGIEADPTGGHYTRRVYDDYETADFTYSEILRARALDVFSLDDNLGTGGSRCLVVGTPYHPAGLIAKAIHGKLDGLKYGLFYAPDTYVAFPQPYTGGEPVLLEDRVTFRCAGAGFPTVEANLEQCQARITLFSKAAKDTVTEIREIVWNDCEHFRVNRPIPSVLGQPLSFVVGNRKPTAPNRFTLDEVDLYPKSEDAPNVIVRQSLERKRIVQGPFINSCQMKLDPIDPSSKMFNPEHIRWVTEKDFPSERRYYRACDFATPKETGCFSSILTGFHSEGGVWLTHLAWGNLKPLDILLELFLGHLRIEDAGHDLIWTSFEGAAIESTLGEFLPSAMADPFKFFSSMGGKYEIAAQQYFEDRGQIFLPKRLLTRGGKESKIRRISSTQPLVEGRSLYVLETMPHRDQFVDELSMFSMEGDNGSMDILDCFADIVREGRSARVVEEKKERQPNQFLARQARAIRNNAIRKRGVLGWR